MPKFKTSMTNVTVDAANNKSSGVEVPQWALFAGVYIPDVDAGNVTLEASPDSGGNYYSVLNPATGNAAVICNSGQDPCVVDISDFIRFVGDNVSNNLMIRFGMANQAAGKTLKVFFRG